ncbi:nucleoside-diphosphate-sugar epimerase [Herbaspirillum sp. CF444]|uniref:NAD-dependent epimerase/dehydratase family protein n=1 Tax=Herbaspirillum sp. CF444 TaxID=1144319 RepID=UPI0002723366|nr:NAD(P)H-binding protein [Herbaspirillum sp. CF444]EJL92998.1 nucleoside-diphosphate-sugar epimerase [Herbaspirillum sp. CF444]
MGEKIFLAGAAGAIGTALVPLLVDAGYEVYGSTRRQARADKLESLGAVPVVVDVFDAQALAAELMRIAPAVVIHQLTDLPQQLDPQAMAEAGQRNARVRNEGTRNLIAAALAAGARHMIAQSIAWAYANGKQPYMEESALDVNAEGARRVSIDGVVALETQVLQAPGLAGTVLRYGQLYGPGTWTMEAKGAGPVHVEAAAHAALLALQKEAVGVFNITEDNAEVSNAKARRQLAWNPAFRSPRAAKNGARS